jgi:hypothetical protein
MKNNISIAELRQKHIYNALKLLSFDIHSFINYITSNKYISIIIFNIYFIFTGVIYKRNCNEKYKVYILRSLMLENYSFQSIPKYITNFRILFADWNYYSIY